MDQIYKYKCTDRRLSLLRDKRPNLLHSNLPSNVCPTCRERTHDYKEEAADSEVEVTAGVETAEEEDSAVAEAWGVDSAEVDAAAVDSAVAEDSGAEDSGVGDSAVGVGDSVEAMGAKAWGVDSAVAAENSEAGEGKKSGSDRKRARMRMLQIVLTLR